MFGSKKITCLVTPGLLKTSFILNPVLQYITVLLELVICFERLMMRCMLHKLFHDMKPRLEQEKATEQNNRITTITPHHHQHQRSWCWMAMQIVVPTQPLTELVGAAHEVQDHFFLTRFNPKFFVCDSPVVLSNCEVQQVLERGPCFGRIRMSNVLQGKFKLTVECQSRWRLLLRSFISQTLV